MGRRGHVRARPACGFTYILGLLYATPSITGLKYAQWASPTLGAMGGAFGGWTRTSPTEWIFNQPDLPVTQFVLVGSVWEDVNMTSGAAIGNPNDDGYYENYLAAYGSDFVAPWAVDASVHGFLQASMAAVADSSSVASLYFSACGWKTGMALTVVLIINLFFAGISSLTVTSRIAFAMARDGAFPGSDKLRSVWGVTKSPILTVLLVFVIDALLLLLPLATTVALNAVLSITVIGYQISYAIPIILRATTGRASFVQSTFNLGRWSLPIHIVAGTWLFLTSFIFLWPLKWPVVVSGVNGATALDDNMNYTCVIVGVTFIASLVYWVVSARHTFKGPLGRMEAAALGEAPGSKGSGLEVQTPMAEVAADGGAGGGDSAQSTPMHHRA